MLKIQPKKKQKLNEDAEASASLEEKVVEDDVDEQAAAAEESEEVKPQEEVEEDAPKDERPKLQSHIDFHPVDTTLNLLASSFGGILTSLSEGGLQHLAAGARANIGVKSGRYMFEVTIVDSSPPASKSFLRVGFSQAGSFPVLSDHTSGAYFDSDGAVVINKKRTAIACKLACGDTVAVVLNLGSQNDASGSISLFKNGVQIVARQQLSSELLGAALFPTISFKGMSVSVNFGPSPRAPLPFRCHMIQDAAEEDVHTSTPPSSASGTSTVLFPICLPGEGSFDWLDMYLEKNPQCTEISDRRILEWATRSGLSRSDRQRRPNDKPGVIDDGTAKRLLLEAAGAQGRDVVVMELKGNLVKGDREELLDQLRLPHFKKVAAVMVGEPSNDFKERVRQLNLVAKQEQIDLAQKAKLKAKVMAKKTEAMRKAVERKRKAQLEKIAQMRAEKMRKLDDMMKATALAKDPDVEEEPKETEGEQEGKEEKDIKAEDVKQEEDVKVEDVKEEMKEEDTKDEMKAEDTKHDEEEVEEDDKEELEDAPKAELTPEESKEWHRIDRGADDDMESEVLAKVYQSFTLPEKEEGFDDVEFFWQDADASIKYLSSWKLQRKSTIRIESLTPGPNFGQVLKQWEKDNIRWLNLQREFKRKESQGLLSKDGEDIKDVENQENDPSENKKTEPQATKLFGDARVLYGDDVAELLSAKVSAVVKRNELDVFGVQSILDIGNGEPLFGRFAPEDWTLCSLRFELWLLTHSFLRDAKDPELRGIPLEHLPFYYNKYFKKPLAPKSFGSDNCAGVIDLVHDTVCLDASGKLVMCHVLEEEITSHDIFVKLTEAARTDRLIRHGNGDPTAALKFSRPSGAGNMAELMNLKSGIDGNCKFALALREKVRDMMMPIMQPKFSGTPAAVVAAQALQNSAAAPSAIFASQAALSGSALSGGARVAPDKSLPAWAQKAKEAAAAAKPGGALQGLIQSLPNAGPRPLPGLAIPLQPKPVGPQGSSAAAAEGTQQKKSRWS